MTEGGLVKAGKSWIVLPPTITWDAEASRLMGLLETMMAGLPGWRTLDPTMKSPALLVVRG